MNSNPFQLSRQDLEKELTRLWNQLLNPPPHENPSPSDEKALVPGTIRGYRSWFLINGGLRSISAHTRWTTHFHAACARSLMNGWPLQRWDDHPVPDKNCTCGLYAIYGPQHDTKGQYLGFQPNLVDSSEIRIVERTIYRVTGVISGSGKAVLGTRGFRVAEARIEALHLPPQIPPGTREKIILGYPGVKMFSIAKDLYHFYPPDDLSHLIPEQASDWGQAT